MNEIWQDEKEPSQGGWTEKGEKYSKEIVHMLHEQSITWPAKF